MNQIELRNVTYQYADRYRRVEVLRGINCAFSRGKFYAVVGKSGSGKSTLLSLMAGLDVPTQGEVLYMGQSTHQLDRSRYRRQDVSVIYQSFRLFPLLTVLENVLYPLEQLGVRDASGRKRAQELLLEVGLKEELFHRFPAQLSGGEQQRVAIARALAPDNRLLLADEPTGNLDRGNSDMVVEILRRLAHERAYCVVMVTHDLSVLPRVDAVYRIEDGLLREGAGGDSPI